MITSAFVICHSLTVLTSSRQSSAVMLVLGLVLGFDGQLLGLGLAA